MKAQLYDLAGKTKGELELPKVFNTPIREDIISKLVEIERISSQNPHSPASTAGRRHSASGTISHRRHKWKGHYGKGISRVPRKAMWRRGTQFYWVAAEVSGTRGGRRVHTPTVLQTFRKVNKKEAVFALNSAIASTAKNDLVKRRYSSLEKGVAIPLPIVIESKVDKAKTKDFVAALKVILGDLFYLAFRNKEVRSGKGKLRGRKYKSNAGILLVTGKGEKIKVAGMDVVPFDDLSVTDFYPLGRLTIFTEKAVASLGGEQVREINNERSATRKVADKK